MKIRWHYSNMDVKLQLNYVELCFNEMKNLRNNSQKLVQRDHWEFTFSTRPAKTAGEK